MPTPREIAERLTRSGSSGHIGKYSDAILKQEIFSLKNTNPMFRDSKWRTRYETIEKAIKDRFKEKKDKNQLLSFMSKLIDANKRMEF